MGQKREKAIEAVRIRIILTLYQKLFEIHFLQNENTYQHIYYAPAFTTLILLFPEPTSSTTKPTTITTGERLHVPSRVMGQKREKAIEAVRIRIILTLYQKLFEIHFLQNENTYQHIYYAPAFTTLILLFPEPTSSTAKSTTITTGERRHVPSRVVGQKREKVTEALRIRSIPT